MKVPLYVVDAFAKKVFEGNPAAVCPLDEWLSDETLQAIAAENNLAETAYYVKEPAGAVRLRWFTPACEVDLCGHATIASAYVLLELLGDGATEVTFESKSGPLKVTRDADLFVLDFPSLPARRIEPPAELVKALGAEPDEVWTAKAYMAVFSNEQEVRGLRPEMVGLAALDGQPMIVTAKGDQVDFVSRVFAPGLGIPEDPVTGSAHCTLIPYWSKQLGKTKLQARQISARGGDVYCEDRGERVSIAGHAVLYAAGTIHI
jgi:predicted PhzF superfamily epimerase YddE/YHI9